MTTRHRFFDLWFTAFPVWTTAFYVCFFWRIAPLDFKLLSPTYFPPGHPNHISWPMFLIFGASLLAIAATAFTLAFVVERRLRPDAWRWWWVLLIIVIPPLGCPLAYFHAGVESAEPRSVGSM